MYVDVDEKGKCYCKHMKKNHLEEQRGKKMNGKNRSYENNQKMEGERKEPK